MYMPNREPKIGTQKTPDSALRKLLSNLINQSSKSRAQIAEEISVHAGQRISKRMLDDWTAESKKPARFPAFLIPIICEVTGDDRLQRWVIGKRLSKLLEFGELSEEVLSLDRRIQRSRKTSNRNQK
jgi:hypothetical protein